MQTYRITATSVYTGQERPDTVSHKTLSATSPAVALKRYLDGGHEAGYKFATVGPNPLKLARGQAINVRIERVG